MYLTTTHQRHTRQTDRRTDIIRRQYRLVHVVNQRDFFLSFYQILTTLQVHRLQMQPAVRVMLRFCQYMQLNWCGVKN